jgi:hypothetical protein
MSLNKGHRKPMGWYLDFFSSLYVILSVRITIFNAQHGREYYHMDAFIFPVTMNGMSLYYSLHILKVQAFIIGWECLVPNTVIPRLTSDPANEFFG